MNPRRLEGARRWYRFVLRVFPRGHRERYGDEMEEAFVVLLQRDHARRRGWGRARCWAGVVWDAVTRGVLMRIRGFGPRLRHVGGWNMLGSIASDIRFGVRSLLRRPLFATTAVATLALGIGANASVFTVVEGIMFRPLPYEEPDELVYLWDENPTLGWEHTDVSAANAWDWRERVRAFDDLAVFDNVRYNMTGDGPPELVTGVTTSPNLFRLLGRTPVLGRNFAADEMGEGIDRVAILSHGFWERRFGADPDVLGVSLLLDGSQTTVIGVLPPDFLFLDERPDLFVPLTRHPSQEPRENHNMNALARLADGATVSLARTEAAQVASALAEEYPDANEGWTVSVVRAHEELLGDVARQASLVLLVAVSFVLLMACVNVANLLLARGGTRRRELAVRAALGAGRGRVLRQLLTESLLLAGVGGVLGVFLAHWGYRSITSALPPQMPPVFRFGIGGSTLAYIAGVTVLSALIFGLAPALRSTCGPMGELRDGGRSSGGRRISRFGGTLVVVQTALAVVLLAGGGLLMKSIGGMRHQDLGFEPDGVLTVRISPPGGDYPGPDDLRAFWDAVETRVARVAGVQAVGTTQSHPLMGSNWGNTVRTAGPDGRPSPERSVRTTYLTPGTFDALGFRVTRGRSLSATDAGDAPQVAVVNEAFVSRYLGDGMDPLTAHLVGDEGSPDIPIVGVVHNIKERAVDRPPEPNMYLALDQAVIRSRSLVIKTAGDPRDFVGAVQEAVWSVDPALPVYSVETMAELIERRIGGFAVIGYLMAAFAMMSLILGAVGIYGVTAFAAQQRTTEIGVRMAMGARGGDVVRMVVRQGAVRAALGLILGLALAFAMGGALSSILVGVSPADPATFVSVTIILAAVSLLGLWLPARRVARVDPVRALASE